MVAPLPASTKIRNVTCSLPHPVASESAPPDSPVASVDPEISSQTVSTRRISFKRPPNPLNRAESPKRTKADEDDDSVFLSVYHRVLGKCQR